MCGIIGYIGKKNAVSVVLDGLKRLEYRGYDSAGIAFYSNTGIKVIRCTGKIKDLSLLIESENPDSHIAIGHTRWATHGRPSDINAHPHRSNSIVLVHNGIVENYLPLKKRLIEDGYQFTSETDTEVLCHLIESYSKGELLENALRKISRDIKGTYAIAVIKEDEPGKIVGLRKDCPLVIGIGEEEFFIASDVPAFLSYTRDVIFLDNEEIVVIKEDGVNIIGPDSVAPQKTITTVSWSPSMAEKGGYKHFMLKEINEQPRAIADTLRGRFDPETGKVVLEEFGINEKEFDSIEKIFIVACGTSYHAALIGKYFIESIVRLPVEVDIASEFRYRDPIIRYGDLLISITQSGETADTLAAQRESKRLGAKVLNICNVVGSTSSREADAVFYTHSGPEIGVASTKAFTTQLVGLYLFAVAFGNIKGKISDKESKNLLRELLSLPGKIEKALETEDQIKLVAKEFFKSRGFLYLGRGLNYPIALEGALKLKEISYIHAEGYPAGEMKHGPIALIDEELPVIVLAPKDRLREKIISNIQEVKSRGGKVISIMNDNDKEIQELSDRCIYVPCANQYLNTIILAIPVQLLAYHIGVLRGCDVDQPRNLAKSVTVE